MLSLSLALTRLTPSPVWRAGPIDYETNTTSTNRLVPASSSTSLASKLVERRIYMRAHRLQQPFVVPNARWFRALLQLTSHSLPALLTLLDSVDHDAALLVRHSSD